MAERASDVYMRADGEEDGHRYQTCTIATLRMGDPFTEEGNTRPAKGLSVLANFTFILDGDPTAPYQPYVLAGQLPTARDIGFHYIAMKCRPGSADWERLPRLGFDAPIDMRLLARIEGLEFALANRAEGVDDLTVRAVLDTEAGRAWWHEQGPIEPILYFDCAEGAESGLILAELPTERGAMAAIAPDEWKHPIPRQRISPEQRHAEAERLARWSDLWHDHLVEVYAQAEVDQYIEQISGTGEEDTEGDDEEDDVENGIEDEEDDKPGV
jgi:hypothetical protein